MGTIDPRNERRRQNGPEVAKLPVAGSLPATVLSERPETEAEVLARYGKTADGIPRVMLAAADATRLAAKRLVDESEAAITAAENILKMLKEEHSEYRREVLRHSENYALRMTEYLTSCHTAAMAMAAHREGIMRVAQAVAENPAKQKSELVPPPLQPSDQETSDETTTTNTIETR